MAERKIKLNVSRHGQVNVSENLTSVNLLATTAQAFASQLISLGALGVLGTTSVDCICQCAEPSVVEFATRAGIDWHASHVAIIACTNISWLAFASLDACIRTFDPLGLGVVASSIAIVKFAAVVVNLVLGARLEWIIASCVQRRNARISF
jgi:hypothetical protein